MKLSDVTHHILYELRSVTSDGFYCLENVYLTVLDHLFDTRVGRTIHAASTSAVTANIPDESISIKHA